MKPQPHPLATSGQEVFRRRLRSVGAFVETGRRLRPGDSPARLLRQVLLSSMGSTDADSGAVFELDPAGRVHLVEFVGPASGSLRRRVLRLGLRRAAGLQEGNLVRSLADDEEKQWRETLRAILPGFAPRIVTRLEGDREGVEGFLLLGSRLTGEDYGIDERSLLSTLSGLFSVFSGRLGEARAKVAQGKRRRAGRDRRDQGETKHCLSSPPEHAALRHFVGRGEAISEILEDLVGVASSSCPVLLEGESGTGKELLARIIHEIACGESAPFEAINCGAIPETLLESELFGHQQGAFTGASRDHRGLFERAHGGTVFLDEIGEVPPAFQVKLLRVLQEGSFHRVGGEQLLRCSSRVIVATNRHLQDEMKAGRFREDLYYRLNVFPIRVPPLRERREDIPLLIDHFLQLHSSEMGRAKVELNPSASRRLMVYSYPGNVRELENLIRALLIEARDSDRISDQHVVSVFSRYRLDYPSAAEAQPAGDEKEVAGNGGSSDTRPIGEWVVAELRRFGFNIALAERVLEARKRSGLDAHAIPVASRSGLTYYLQGECLRVLSEEGWSLEAAALRIAGGGELVARVRRKIRRYLESAIDALEAGGKTPAGRMRKLRLRFAKLPAEYGEVLVLLLEEHERGGLKLE